MLSRTRVKVLGGGVVLGALAWIGASGVVGACAEKKSAIMLAITTDMKAPKDVNAVSVTISTNGAVKHSFIGRVTPQGEIELPATLAIVEPEELGATVRVRVMAFQENKPRVLRDVRTSIPKGGRTGLLRIPLNFANDGSTKSPPLPDGVLPAPRVGSVTTKSGNAGEFDFLASFQPDCPDVLNQTWIDGACADNEVKFESLPDFDPAAIVPASGAGCFDVGKCLAAATPVAERLDLATCTLTPPEGGASGLNLALVTRETGECNASGDCFVPLDRGASGWREEGGKIALPAYVCRLVKAEKARLFERRAGACASKEENQTVCSGAGGGSAEGGAEGGPDAGPSGTLVAKLGFATAVSVSGNTLYAAGTQVGSLDLARAGATLTPIAAPAPPDAGPAGDSGAGDAGLPTRPLPWRLAAGGTGLAAANGSRGYLADPAMGLIEKPVGLAVDVAAAGSFVYWATTAGAFFSDPASANPGPSLFPGAASPVSAIAAADGVALVGRAGTIELCLPAEPACDPPLAADGAPFQAIAFDPVTGPNNFKAYALAERGVYEIPSRRSPGEFSIAQLPVTPSGTLRALSANGAVYARGLVAGAKCVYFTSSAGLEYATTGSPPLGGVIASSASALGVALRTDTTGNETVYFTVFAADEAGGGVYRVASPAACASAR